jgi:hypothetical protein
MAYVTQWRIYSATKIVQQRGAALAEVSRQRRLRVIGCFQSRLQKGNWPDAGYFPEGSRTRDGAYLSPSDGPPELLHAPIAVHSVAVFHLPRHTTLLEMKRSVLGDILDPLGADAPVAGFRRWSTYHQQPS